MGEWNVIIGYLRERGDRRQGERPRLLQRHNLQYRG